MSSTSTSSVQVAIRVRPFLSAEAGNARCVEIIHNGGIRIGGEQGAQFTFDFCLGVSGNNNNNNTQQYVYQTCIEPMTMSCLAGYNATIFAYGQTGSGKTFTVLGGSSQEAEGILPRALRDLFARLECARDKGSSNHTNDSEESEKMGDDDDSPQRFQFEVRLQFLELYGEEVRDLLSPAHNLTKLSIRDYGNGGEPEVVGASEVVVSSPEEALLLLERGSFRRVTGATAMNSASSRSHAIITMLIEQQCSKPLRPCNTSNETEEEEEEEVEIKRSKFHFVDLAGSERQKRTGATGDRLKEGIDINKGLLALGNVISALGGDPQNKNKKKKNKTFVPYRDSKLTRLLKGSLGGNHKTLMIACISPSASNMAESLCCLRYANRAKNIQNNAVINVDAGSRKLAELRAQVQMLARELLSIRVKGDVPNDNDTGGGNSGTNEECGPLTLQVLTSLAKGEDVDVHKLLQQQGTLSLSSSSDDTTLNQSPAATSRHATNLDAELRRTQDSCRQSQDQVQNLAQEVYSANAEKEYYRLKLQQQQQQQQQDGALLSLSFENCNDVTTTADDSKGSEECDENKSVFIGRMAAYEKEIAELKRRLLLKKEEEQVKSHCVLTVPKSGALSRSMMEGKDDSDALLSSPKEEDDESDHAMNHFRIQKYLNTSDESFHQEEKDEEDDNNLEPPHVCEVSMDSAFEIDQHLHLAKDNSGRSTSALAVAVHVDDSFESEDGDDTIKDVSFLRRQKTMDAHIVDISKNIVAKEELLRQLNSMKGKYEDMRHFYEDKLRKMEYSVQQKEKEREDLRKELERLENDNKGAADQTAKVSAMKRFLQEKDSRIAALKVQQSELKNLTKISSKNEQHIERLKRDVLSMKRQRIDLQKQIKGERKAHADEMKALKMKARKLDREALKLRHESERKTKQIENAQRLAKTRLEEVGRVRSKYREAEKRLRMQTLKQGVMASAGVDPIMMGRRESNRSTPTTRKGGSNRNAPEFNKLRHFFDEKVVEIGKIEESAEKLALEWEDHMRLLAQKEDLMENADENDANVADEIESLDVQLSFKEQRIRQLSGRLRKPIQASRGGDISKIDLLLNDADLQSINSGMSTVSSSQAMVKVLFGMVVRERKRVTVLARTASKLDEKALESKKLVESTDAALRAQISEQLHERTTIANEKQDLILSLMSLVKEGSSSQAQQLLDNSGDTSNLEPIPEMDSSLCQSNLAMTLAKQRMAALEEKIVSLKDQNDSKSNDDANMKELMDSLADEKRKNEQLRTELLFARKSLRQIRDSVPPGSASGPARSKNSSRSSSPSIGLDVVSGAAMKLGNRGSATKADVHAIIRKALSRPLTPPIADADDDYHRSADHMSDSDSDDETVPDWADDIMADLQIIAEGGVPESLRSKEQEVDMNNVFSRLANPVYFTGTRKHARNPAPASNEDGEHSKDGNHKPVKSVISLVPQFSSEYATVDNNSRAFQPTVSTSRTRDGPVPAIAASSSNTNNNTTQAKNRRSVYQRLMSPSSYTGTRKSTYEENRQKQQVASESSSMQQMPPDDLSMHYNINPPSIPPIPVADSPSKSRTKLRYRSISNESEKSGINQAVADDVLTRSEKAISYTRQNVFERLQHTVTAAYAGKFDDAIESESGRGDLKS